MLFGRPRRPPGGFVSNANAVLSPSSPSRGLDSAQRLAQASALDREIRGLHRRRNGDLARLTERLAQLRESLGYLSLGFASVQDYAKAQLGWGAGKVKALLELHGRLPRQPCLAEAFGAGEVDWSKAVLASRARRESLSGRRTGWRLPRR
jgi:hypothetical protein